LYICYNTSVLIFDLNPIKNGELEMKTYVSPWVGLAVMALFGLFLSMFWVPARKEENAAISKAMIAKVESSIHAEEIPFCKKEVDNKNPEAILWAMDYDLNEVAKGVVKGNPCGSFSDRFIPLAYDALQAGVSKKEVNVRIGRLIVLAKKGQFLSNYEADLFKDGGEKAVREYIDSTLKWMKKHKE
jgi:hypothetical protein